MIRSLHRRLDRLKEQFAAGRMIVLSIADEHLDDDALIAATLAAAEIERTDRDLVVLVRRFWTSDTEPLCSLSSVSPLPPSARKAMR